MSDTFSPFAPQPLTDEETIAKGRKIFDEILDSIPAAKKEITPIAGWVITATSGESPMMFFKQDKTWSGDIKDAARYSVDECVAHYAEITQAQNFPVIYQGAQTKIDLRPLILGPGGMIKL